MTVTYDLADADGDSVLITLLFSSNNNGVFDIHPVSVSGDVNHFVDPGTNKTILWDAAADVPGIYLEQMVARVIGNDAGTLADDMIFIPAGGFPRGSDDDPATDNPEQTVVLSSYYIDKYEVTNAAYQQFIENDGYQTPAYWSSEGWAWKSSNGITEPYHWTWLGHGVAYPGFPVSGVSYYEAEAYASFVGKRLPTEAEWEKAARGLDERTYPWGETITGGNANYAESLDPYESTTLVTPVGFYAGRLFPDPPFQTLDSPGPYGNYDLCGNVGEWVRDWYDADYYLTCPLMDPPGPVTGTQRSTRGGTYTGLAANEGLKSYSRHGTSPTQRRDYNGFRCAKSQ